VLRTERTIGYGFILIAAVCWGLLGPVARWALAAGVTPLEIAFWRAVIGGVCFMGHATWLRTRRGAAPMQRQHLPLMLLFGLIGVSLFYSAYQFAVEAGGAALASVLLYTAPAWVAIIGVTALGERLTAFKTTAVALTLLGVGGIAFSGANSVQLTWGALGWGLASSLSYALYYPFGKRYFDDYAPATVFAYALPVGALGLWPLVTLSDKSAGAWGALAFIGLISTYGAYLAYGAGLRRLEASRASIVATLEPVVAAVVAHGWWGERFGLWGYVGAALVLTAAFLAAADPAPEKEAERAGT
jgi:DME family drug/metabolite transporter